MDPLTQGALGGLAALGIARPEHRLRNALVGALAGLLPDADVFIRSAADPTLFLVYHRQFTHSLVFIPVGAAVAAGIGALLSRGRARWSQLYLPALLGYATHGLLDACTSYGTLLLWPFSDHRVAWRVISVVDPLFTLPLALGVVLATWRGRRALVATWAWVLLYLSLGVVQHHRALATAQALAAERGHQPVRAQVKPAFGNLVLWRSLYQVDGQVHVDAVRAPLAGSPQVFEGGSLPRYDVAAVTAAQELPATTVHDLHRFSAFSDGWLALHPDHPTVIGDIRYAMLPHELAPIWGIDLAQTTDAGHHEFVRFREVSDSQRRDLVAMVLWGVPPGNASN